MFFYLSKVLWFLTAPSNVLIALALAGAWLCGTRFARAGRRLALAATGLLLFIGIAPLGSLLFLGLESRFPTLPHKGLDPYGIIVLGGAVDEAMGQSHGQISLEEAAERMTEGAALARLYPNAKLVFTGGSNAFFGRDGSEAGDAKRLWMDLGIPGERILLEDKSRNTYENAVMTRDLIRPQLGERWLLVTSAFHMPRSVSLFRKAGFPVIPFPVDYRSEASLTRLRPMRESSDGLRRFDLAAREWIGLAAYWASGKTDALLPGP
jgi:uncharacterized SAM-binding protein YcdF (DUF218 family)